MSRYTLAVITVAACLALSVVPPAWAHEGPEHDIEELTERMKHEGESADLLLQRAIEYNVLNRSTEAIKDLEKALVHEPKSAVIHRELARAYFGAGKTNEAYDTARRGMQYAEVGAERGALLMIRSELSRARKDFTKALDEIDRALKDYPEQSEWYLARSQVQQQLGLKKERIKGLEDGIRETGSGLLEAEWVDAMIDAGRAAEVLPKIENEIKEARLQSAWLLRRAKVRIAQGKHAQARTDLEAALQELNERLGRGAPNPLALVDRGEIHELLGLKDEARKDYESARDKGVQDEWLRERIRTLRGEKRDGKKDEKKDSKADEKKEEKKAEDKKDEGKKEDPSDDAQ